MEDLFTGKIIVAGLVIGLIALASDLLRATGEGARRVRIVLGALPALALAVFITSVAGFGGLTLAITAAVVLVWVVRGFRG